MTDRPRAVFDTNVFVSAFLSRNPSSPTDELLRRWLEGEITLLVSQVLLDEIIDKLREKGISEERIIALAFLWILRGDHVRRKRNRSHTTGRQRAPGRSVAPFQSLWPGRVPTFMILGVIGSPQRLDLENRLPGRGSSQRRRLTLLAPTAVASSRARARSRAATPGPGHPGCCDAAPNHAGC